MADSESQKLGAEQEAIKQDENCVGVRMRIRWDFPGREDRDLELKADDIIELISRLDEDWCYGETKDGRQGYFPFVYAEVVQTGNATDMAGSNKPIPPPKTKRDESATDASGELQGRPTGDKELNSRNRVVDEIVVTEHSYAMYMKAVCNVYRKRLQDEMSEADLKTCFSNVEQLMQFTNVFLPELRRAAKADDEMIGKVYKQFSPFFKMYAAYCGGHAKASQKMEELSSKKKIQKLLDKCQEEPECKGQNIQSLLIMPIQRVPRHKLLLKELLKHTPEDHPDYGPCKEALDAISVVASHVNEHIRLYQSILKVWEVQRSMRPRPEIFHQGCTFIHSGPLVKKTSRGSEVRYFFLFSDCLVYAKELPIVVNNVRYQYRQTVKVASVLENESEIPELQPAEVRRSTSFRRSVKGGTSRKRSMSKTRSSIYRRISVSVAGVSEALSKATSPDGKGRRGGSGAKPSTPVAEGSSPPPASDAPAPQLPSLRGDKVAGSAELGTEDAAKPAEQVPPENVAGEEPEKPKTGDDALKQQQPEDALVEANNGGKHTEQKQLYPFKVLATKSLILYAASESERQEWVKHLRENCDPEVVTDEAKKQGEIHQQEMEEQAILDAQKGKIKVSAPVPLKTVTAWYTLQPRKSSPFRRSSSTSSNPNGEQPEIQISFHISKTGDDLSRAGPVNSLSLMYLTLTVISAKGLRVADSKRNTSDPYCVVTCGKKRVKRTKTCKSTLEPVWYEQFRDLEFIAGIFSTIQIEVFHEQHWRTDTSLGVVSISMDKLLELAGVSVQDLDASASVISETAKDDKVMQRVKKGSVVDAESVEFRVATTTRSGVVEIRPANVALPKPEQQLLNGEAITEKPLPTPPPLPKPRSSSQVDNKQTTNDSQDKPGAPVKPVLETTDSRSDGLDNNSKASTGNADNPTLMKPSSITEKKTLPAPSSNSTPTKPNTVSAFKSATTGASPPVGKPTVSQEDTSTTETNKKPVNNSVDKKQVPPPKPPAPKLTQAVKDKINPLAVPRRKQVVVPKPLDTTSKVISTADVKSLSQSLKKPSPIGKKLELKQRLFRLLAEHGSTDSQAPPE